jgi:hypothetical protein
MARHGSNSIRQANLIEDRIIDWIDNGPKRRQGIRSPSAPMPLLRANVSEMLLAKHRIGVLLTLAKLGCNRIYV